MERAELKMIIESLLFSSDSPLKLRKIQELFPDEPSRELRQVLIELMAEYDRLERSFYLREVADGYQFCTRPEYSEWIRKLKKSKQSRFGSATMETLAIIAYKQPLTRVEIEDIRGVDVGGIVRTLLEKKLIKIAGKKDVPGKPLLYATTPKFLTVFGLKSLKDLPSLEDIAQITDTSLPLFASQSQDIIDASNAAASVSGSLEPTSPEKPTE